MALNDPLGCRIKVRLAVLCLLGWPSAAARDRIAASASCDMVALLGLFGLSNAVASLAILGALIRLIADGGALASMVLK
jgi:hypothetical protein